MCRSPPPKKNIPLVNNNSTDLFGSKVRRGVDEERLVTDVLLDLLPRSLAVLEAFLR